MNKVKEILNGLPLLPSWARSSPKIGYAIYGVEAIAVVLLAVYLYMWPWREYTLPYRNLRGPKAEHWFWGNVRTFLKSEPMVPHGRWIKEYGPTFRYRVIAGMPRFYTADPAAVSYILNHSDTFPKPPQTRKAMADMLGNGVLVAEGHDHKRQRKLLNPSFSPAAIKGMVPIFYDKSYELKEKFISLIEGDLITTESSPTPPVKVDVVKGTRKIDVMSWLGKTTLDVIGLAGFNYDFKALEDPNNELAEAYRKMFSAGMEVTIGAIIQALFPIFQIIPTERMRTVRASTKKTKEIGQRLIDEKKRAIAAAHHDGFEKQADIGNDLLSHLIKANMASDLRPDQKLSDEEVLAQITTFMLAGNETSSTALTWILYSLAQHTETQKKLRDEAMEVPDERPSLETLNALPYMDAVIREVLRLCAPAPATMRQSMENTVVPLSVPVKGRDGKMIESINLPKGAMLMIPILNVNTLEQVWGPDADKFNPERFLKSSSLSSNDVSVGGVWGNLLTFLGGTRNCIGYRFALAEIKVILFVLIRGFEFEELPSKPVIERKAS
nr:cytochrome P450 [Kwoniella dejecticola CBS 10117]OBR81547.1 cytochrome P450 [Kwoniella dejecticola CBS 10117]